MNSKASQLRKKRSSATIAADVKRFCHQIKTDDVFGTHTSGKDQPYPRLMACNARICLAVRKGTKGDDALGQELAALAKAELGPDPEFWDLIHLADFKMSETILLADNPPAAMAEIVDAYRRAYNHIGSPVKLGSVYEQLDFYEDIFASGDAVSKQRRECIVALARSLREALQAAVSTEQTSAS